MDYTQELLDSLLWISKAMAITAVVFPLAVYILAKNTRWGRQFWLLAKGYLTPTRTLQPIIYFVIIVFFNLLSVRLDILDSDDCILRVGDSPHGECVVDLLFNSTFHYSMAHLVE